jgi:hypothetical protein
MVGVRVEVEDADAGEFPDGACYAGDLLSVASLTEVGDGFKELGRHRPYALTRPEGAALYQEVSHISTVPRGRPRSGSEARPASWAS